MSEPGHSRQRARDSADVEDGARSGTARRPIAIGPLARRPQLILVILLIALVIAGVRAGPGLHWTSSWHGPWHDHGTAVGVTLELTLATLLIALWILRRRSPEPGWPAERLRRILPPLIALGMIAQGLVLVHGHFSLGPPTRRRTPPARVGLSRRPAATSHLARLPTTGIVAVEYVLMALVLLAVIAAFVVLLRRRRDRMSVSDELIPEDDDTAALRSAVEAGRTALAGLTEARMAIIACYLAMERSLAEAGTARGLAETADELLARASAADLLHGDAAAILTELFYQARFSSRELPSDARQTALRVLDAIVADLRATAATRHRPRAHSVPGP